MSDFYIINKHGVLHSLPDGWPLPVGARVATKDEIAAWEKRDAAGKAALRAEKQAAKLANAATVVVAATEKQLEAETGHDVVQTGKNPPTLVETDRPKPEPKK